MPKKTVLAAAVALALGVHAFAARAQTTNTTALPTGGQVVGGQATVSQSGAAMTIDQSSARAALNWQSFNIGSQASVTFNQPSASAIALNRVLGASGSEIYGRLSSNGQVFLINPNGVLFGRGAQVDVGGLLASTLSMSSEDFMNGRYVLRGDGSRGKVVNEGDIRAPRGSVSLVAPSVRNDGVIEAQHGSVTLAAANAATVDYMADGLVRIRIDEGAIAAEIANNGVLRADGGVITLSAKSVDNLARAVVNNTGIIEARTVENVNGVVRLGGDDVYHSGRIDVSAEQGAGGSVHALGDRVALTGSARIDASGAQGGGEVLIGGDYLGRNPDIQNASRTYVGLDAVIDASAAQSGNGGRVIVWSDDATRFYGSISATGGAAGGDGGFVEVSGKRWLDFQGNVNLAAPQGSTGTLLLDPKNIVISALAPDGAVQRTSATELDEFSDNPSETSWLTGAQLSLLIETASVMLQADNDISFNDSVSAATPSHGLTALAGRSIFVNADISVTDADVTLRANYPSAPGTNRESGPGVLTMAGGTTISAGAGAVTLHVGPGSGGGGDIIAANIDAANIELQQNSLAGNSILHATPDSLLKGTNLLLEVDSFGSGRDGTIGTDTQAIRVQVTRLEAHTHEESAGIFIESLSDLQIGGVPFFPGLVKGVQTVGGGEIRITVNGSLSTLPGDAGCGLTGGSGGPICAGNATASKGDITLRATGITLNSMVVSQGSPSSTVIVDAREGTLAINDAVSATAMVGNATVNLSGAAITADAATIQADAPGGEGLTVHHANVDFLAGSGGISLEGTFVNATGVGLTNGDGNVSLETTGSITVANSTISASGFNPDVGIHAFGAVSITDSTLTATAEQEVAAVFVESIDDAVTIANSSLIGDGAQPGTIENEADITNVNAVAARDVSLSDVVMRANGGSGVGQVNVFAGGQLDAVTQPFIHLGGGDVSFVGGTVSATGTDVSRSGAQTGVNMVGDTITQTATSSIESPRLKANATNGILLNEGNNLVSSSFIAANTSSNGVHFRQRAGHLLTVNGISQSGGDVEITSDDLDIAGAINAGSGTVYLRANTLARDIGIQTGDVSDALSLSAADLGFITAGTLEIGRNDSTGTMNVTAFPGPGFLNASSVRLYAQDVVWMNTGLGGTGNEATHSLEIRASNNLSISDSTLLFADGVDVSLVADNDNSGLGNLAITNTGAHRTILVGTSAANTGSMLLSGANVAVTDHSGTTMTVVLAGSGTQQVSALDTVLVQGGSIQADSSAQIVSANEIRVLGGNTFGRISGGTQTITAGSGGVLVQGGNGIGNNAAIEQLDTSGTQTIIIGGGGTLTVQGGDGPSGFNNAEIFSGGTSQTISFTSGGTLMMIGGANGVENYASIESQNGNIAITGSPDITLQGGASGGAPSQGNDAVIFTEFGATLTIDANNLRLSGGAGVEAEATMSANSVLINYTGTVQISGGSGTGAVAGVTSDASPISITLVGALGSGDVVMTGGSGGMGSFGFAADALLGSTAFDANVSVQSRGNIVLNKGLSTAGFGAGIGSGTGGGSIDLTAGLGGSGDLSLNDATIRTTGAVALNAPSGQITQAMGPGGVLADTLVATAATTIALHGSNAVNTFAARTTDTTDGSVHLNHTQSLTVGSVDGVNGITTGSGPITLAAAGDLILDQPLTTGNVDNPGSVASSAVTITAHSITGGANITTGSASGSIAQSFINLDATDGSIEVGSLSTGTANGDTEVVSFVEAFASGALTTGNIVTGAAIATDGLADSSVFLTADTGAINTGAIQTGNAFSSTWDATSQVALQGPGNISVASILTGNATGETADSSAELYSFEVGDIAVTGPITTGVATASSIALSYVNLNSASGAVMASGAITSGDAHATGIESFANASVMLSADGQLTAADLSGGDATADSVPDNFVVVFSNNGDVTVGAATAGVSNASTAAESMSSVQIGSTAGNVTLNGDINVTAASGGIALAWVFAGGDITINRGLSTLGAGTVDQLAEPSGIQMTAGGSIISAGGILNAQRVGAGEVYVDLNAVHGIGTVDNPVRIEDPDFEPPTGPVVLARNVGTGASGDIAVSFRFGSNALLIDASFTGFQNDSPDGAYSVRLEQGDITLNTAFVPDVPLFGNQSVLLSTPQGNINLASGAEIQTTGSGSVVLTASGTEAGFINLSGATLAAQDIQLAASDTVRVQSGVNTLNAVNPLVNAGRLDVANGATLATGDSGLLNPTGSVITGTGTIDVGTGTLTSDGTIRPGGTAPGTLTIAGNLLLGSTSVVDVKVLNPWTTPGVDFDSINVSGTASLGGTLNIVHLDGQTPAAGQPMQLITASSVVGTFPTVNAPALYTEVYNASDFRIVQGAFVNTWRLAGGGDWNTASNWSFGHVPTDSEDVQIPELTGQHTITLTGAAIPRSFTFLGDETFFIDSTGTLTFTGASAMGSGTLWISGGAVNANGSLAVFNLNLQSGGTLGGTGATSVAGAFNWSGGTIAAGAGVFSTAGIATLTGPASLDGRTWDNLGFVDHSADRLTLMGNALITNRGGWNLASTDSTPLTGAGAFHNLGSFTTSTTVTQVISPTEFRNDLVLTVTAGTLDMAAPTFTQAGIIDVAAGATFRRDGGFTNTGLLQGSGTIDVGAGTLFNDGALAPAGFGVVGNLNIVGNYTQGPNGVLHIDLGSQDVLAVTGAANLDGTLVVNHTPTFDPSADPQFTPLTYGSVSGDFATKIFPTGATYSTVAGPSGYGMVFSAIAPPAQPQPVTVAAITTFEPSMVAADVAETASAAAVLVTDPVGASESPVAMSAQPGLVLPDFSQLFAAMSELRRKKVEAVETASAILERNPAAADLAECAGPVSANCIAPRPAASTSEARPKKIALLIGVADYQAPIPKLGSPHKDVTEIGNVYREQFGYEVRTLLDADKASIVREMNRLILETGESDSVMVFYAGHGHVVEKTGRGYWIPGKATGDDPALWISNSDIAKMLTNIPARQLLLVSDSCYSGTLTREGKVEKSEVLADPSAVLERRAVTVLSSGGEEPVADEGREGHSVFAWHLLRTLRRVSQLSPGVDVYERLAEGVTLDFPQQPQYGAALGAGHQPGADFLFEVRR